MRSAPRGRHSTALHRTGAVLLALGLCGCSLMDFDGLASGPPPSGGSSGVSGLGLDAHLGDGGASGNDAGTTTIVVPNNLITNPGFEMGPSRWSAVGSCQLTLSADNPHGGSSCLLVSQRQETWEGPGYDLSAVLARNSSYRASVWARVADGSYTMTLTYKHRCVDETGDPSYSPLGSNRVSTDWVEVTALVAVPDCQLSDSLLYVEGPPAGTDFYIDDTSIVLDSP